jgi:hypothetical protein
MVGCVVRATDRTAFRGIVVPGRELLRKGEKFGEVEGHQISLKSKLSLPAACCT